MCVRHVLNFDNECRISDRELRGDLDYKDAVLLGGGVTTTRHGNASSRSGSLPRTKNP